MSQKTKKKLNYNILGYILLTIFTLFLGFLTGFKVNMLKVNATTFNNSSITYNSDQTLVDDSSSSTSYLKIFMNNQNVYSVYKYDFDQNGYKSSTNIYTNCTLNNNVLLCANGFIYYNDSTSIGNIAVTNNTFTINSDNVVYSYEFTGFGTYTRTYTILFGGYTEQQYEAYGQQQYTAGQNSVINNPNTYGLYTLAQYNDNYTAGQNSVISNPNTYNLYTTQQYNTYGTNQYNSGYSAGSTAKENDILANPNNYGLYSSAQYVAYGTSQYNAGIQYVQDNPSTYNLYTLAQYNSYGTSQYNSGLLAGQNDVINNPHNYNLYTSTEYNNNYTAGQNAVINDPHTYNLYTSSEYNTYGTSQYNAGYLAGLNDNEVYNLGIQHVLNNPHDYDLYTESEYNTYGTNQYNAGIQHVLDNWEDYNLYNQTQLETYGQTQYSAGYQDGIDTYEYEQNNPNFPTYNIYTSGDSELNISDTNIIKPSDYLNYSNTYINNGNSYVTLETYQYEIRLSESVSSNSTMLIPTSINNLSIKFCNWYLTEYSVLGQQTIFCKSIATNLPAYESYENWGIDTPYYNKGISLYNNNFETETIDNVEYYVINLQDYLVAEDHQFNVILLSDIISNEYNNIYIELEHSYINSDSYNLGYQNGYNTGNLVGVQTANKSEYNHGYNDGYKQATRVGDNSIRGLAETILTSPVEMFKTMFNVEFLDINLAGFILSIFTVIVVIWLIKKLW